MKFNIRQVVISAGYFIGGIIFTSLVNFVFTRFRANIFQEKVPQEMQEQTKLEPAHLYEIEIALCNNIYDAKKFVASYSNLPNIKIVQHKANEKKYFYIRIGLYKKWNEAKQYLMELDKQNPELNGTIMPVHSDVAHSDTGAIVK